MEYVLVFVFGFILGGTCIYAAFDAELKQGRVISGSKVYKASRIL